MKTMKYLGCLLALVFAGASAFAAETTWFTAPIDGTMTGWENTAGWVYVDTTTGGKLNNWSGENEMSFTAGTTKTLPADTTTIKTTVKFTAMDKADFDELEFPTDAKGGLTIVEEEGGSFFYGIVEGAWVKLAGDTTDALAGQVEVVVDIYGNNGKFIKYTVGGVALTYNEAEAIPTTFTGDTISSVSYKGLCEIKSLAGFADASIFDLTVPNKVNATAVVKVNGATISPVEVGSNVYAITSGHEGTVTVEYKPVAGYKVFGTQPAAITDDLAGDTTLKVSSDLESKLIVACVGMTVADDLHNAYATLADAIYAVDNTVDSFGKVTLVATSGENENITVGKTVMLLDNANACVVAGSIAVGANGNLLVKGGKYNVDFSVVADTDGVFAFEGGQFVAEKSAVQPFCTLGYFADATGDQNYPTEVVEGTPVEPSGAMPAIVVDPAIVPAGTPAATYMADVNNNGLYNWQNFALGLLDEETAKGTPVTTVPTIIKDEVIPATDVALVLDVNVPGNAASGFDVVITDTKTAGKISEDGVLTLNGDAIGDHIVKIQLKDEKGNCYDVGTATKTIGVAKPVVTAAEKADVKLVTVPYKKIDGSAMTIDEVINKANLNAGDTLSIYNGSDYDNYVLTSGEWVKEDKGGAKLADAAAPVTVKPGQGLWLKTAVDDFYQYGLVDNSAATVTINAGWNLIGIQGTALALTAIKEAESGDMIRVEDVATQIPVEYTYDGEKWTYNAVETSTVKLPNGRTVTKKTVTQTVVLESIPVNVGCGVWYVSKTGAASINL